MSRTGTPGLPDQRRSYLGQYAGFASRLVAFIIDVLLIGVILLFSGWFISTSINLIRLKPTLLELTDGLPVLQTVLNFLFGPVFSSLVTLAFIVGYYLLFWLAAGQTPGKYLIGIKIVALDSDKLKLRHAILRYAGYYLSGLAFGLGFLWILVDDERRAWHDRFAGTCVIYVWDAQPDEVFLVQAMHQLHRRQEALKAFIKRQQRRKKPD